MLDRNGPYDYGKSFLGGRVRLKINLQGLLAFALVVSVAANVFGFLQSQKIAKEAAKSQELVASLQKKVKVLEQSNISSRQPASRLSRDEYIARRAAQQRKRSSAARLSAQNGEVETRQAHIDREAVQRGHQGSAQAIQ